VRIVCEEGAPWAPAMPRPNQRRGRWGRGTSGVEIAPTAGQRQTQNSIEFYAAPSVCWGAQRAWQSWRSWRPQGRRAAWSSTSAGNKACCEVRGGSVSAHWSSPFSLIRKPEPDGPY
jgi:hypothetical protein